MSCEHGVAIGEFCPVCDVVDAKREKVIASARLALERHVWWTTLPLRVWVPPEEGAFGTEAFTPTCPFRSHWLIVTTPGFLLSVQARGRKVLDRVDGDLFLPGMWDRLERESQLERVRFDTGALGVADSVLVSVTRRTSKSHDFRAGMLGRQLVT